MHFEKNARNLGQATKWAKTAIPMVTSSNDHFKNFHFLSILSGKSIIVQQLPIFVKNTITTIFHRRFLIVILTWKQIQTCIYVQDSIGIRSKS